MEPTDFRQLDWGRLTPLRLKAPTVAEGIYAGAHRSARRGAGIEFGGHRSYVPGDDLRWLDWRALIRHGRPYIREFETETDRTLRLLLDASTSMAYRSPDAPGAKLAYAALLAGALGRVALAAGDPVGLHWLGGDGQVLPPAGGRDAFDRLLHALESVRPGGNVDLATVERVAAGTASRSRRGSVIVLFSDLFDLPEESADRLVSLATGGRTLVAVRVLDPAEASFPFQGPVRLRASEGDAVTETDGAAARAGYLAALEENARYWDRRLVERGGRLVRCVTTNDPVETVRAVLAGVEGRAA